METVIYNMLKEEKTRNLEMQKIYLQEIDSLPKGTVTIKNISGNDYYYLKYRQNEKIKTDYLGKNKKKVDVVNKEIKRRKYLQGVLKRLRVEYKQICKIVKD